MKEVPNLLENMLLATQNLSIEKMRNCGQVQDVLADGYAYAMLRLNKETNCYIVAFPVKEGRRGFGEAILTQRLHFTLYPSLFFFTFFRVSFYFLPSQIREKFPLTSANNLQFLIFLDLFFHKNETCNEIKS